MVGLAQKLFFEKEGRKCGVKETFISTLLERKAISMIDFFLAERLLIKGEEDQLLFLCYLAKAMREGHLCVQLDPLLPEPRHLIRPEEGRLSPQEQEKLKTLILNGIKSLPSTLPIIRRDNHLYFQRYWRYEETLLKHFERLQNTPPTLLLDTDAVEEKLNRIGDKLLPEQREAIFQACQNSFTMICGGPGTGKTYTAGLLLQLIPEGVEIALAAPTGKAAANLQKAVKEVKTTAKTLHSLLWKHASTLSADFILIDESSMIDAKMMAKLLSAIKPGARLVFLGDPYQLPPVEAGSPFADLTHLSNPIELKKCLRSDLKGILEFASAVKAGDFDRSIQMLEEGEGIKRVHFEISDDRIKAIQEAILKYAMQYLPKNLEKENSFRILSPMRQGPFGVDVLNQLLHERNSQSPVAPIMIVSNDYRLDLFNGETGILIKEENVAVFKSNSGERRIPAILLPKYEYAYCLSVHKSQGSEFDHVLALVPPGSETFGREVLYTAATRARKQLDIWGKDETLKETIARKSERISGVKSLE